jgi:hypothetical protein
MSDPAARTRRYKRFIALIGIAAAAPWLALSVVYLISTSFRSPPALIQNSVIVIRDANGEPLALYPGTLKEGADVDLFAVVMVDQKIEGVFSYRVDETPMSWRFDHVIFRSVCTFRVHVINEASAAGLSEDDVVSITRRVARPSVSDNVVQLEYIARDGLHVDWNGLLGFIQSRLWIPTAWTLACVIPLGVLVFRWRGMPRKGHCHLCGYEIGVADAKRCPECGEDVK